VLQRATTRKHGVKGHDHNRPFKDRGAKMVKQVPAIKAGEVDKTEESLTQRGQPPEKGRNETLTRKLKRKTV